MFMKENLAVSPKNSRISLKAYYVKKRYEAATANADAPIYPAPNMNDEMSLSRGWNLHLTNKIISDPISAGKNTYAMLNPKPKPLGIRICVETTNPIIATTAIYMAIYFTVPYFDKLSSKLSSFVKASLISEKSESFNDISSVMKKTIIIILIFGFILRSLNLIEKTEIKSEIIKNLI